MDLTPYIENVRRHTADLKRRGAPGGSCLSWSKCSGAIPGSRCGSEASDDM